MDKKINENGTKLLTLLSNYDLMIGNGCIMGDLEGNLTCSSWNGFSTNDLFVLHRDLYHQINYLKIDENFQWYSDHKSMSISLRVNVPHHRSNADLQWKKIFKHSRILRCYVVSACSYV